MFLNLDSDHETEPVVTVKPVLLSTAELNLKQQKDAGLKKTALCVKGMYYLTYL